MSIPKAIESYLTSRQVAFETIHHRRDFTAQEAAADTHTKGRDFAKTVLLWVDDSFCMAVVPAHEKVDLEKVRSYLNAHKVKLATEDEIESLCPNCEVGAMPPVGDLYNLPVYISPHLTYDHKITFNAGTHDDVVRMKYRDYDQLVKPKVIDLTLEN